MKTSRTLIILSFLTFLFISSNLSAQKPPMKFGVISKGDLQMTHYSLDSGASAVILCDYGESKIKYAHRQGWKLITEVHRRIKIFNKDGYKWANGEVYLWHQYGNKEKLNFLKGMTYNLEGNKIVKSKLEKTAIFEEKYDANRDVKKFTMPDVKEGSIIEYSYTIVSDFLFNFNDWEFQSTIPVAWSEYRTKIPEIYIYKVVPQGYLPFHIATSEMVTQTETVAESGTSDLQGGRSESRVDDYRYQEERKVWVVKDAPKFEFEDYMTSYKNYISKVSYELAYTKQRNSPTKDVMGTWDKFNERFLLAEYFGEHLNRAWRVSNPISNLNLDGLSDQEKISAVYNFVKSNVSWNGVKRCRLKITADYSLRNPLNNGKGNSAEVNLILTTLLRKAGIKADPVLISTRDHGIIRKEFPMTDQFNYVICQAYFGDQYVLLDATDRLLPINMLPERCLNGSGWIVSRDNPGWINITSGAKKSTRISGALTLNDDGSINGNLKYDYSGYNARSPRDSYFKSGEENYVDDKINNSIWEINELELENPEDLSQSFIEKYDFEIDSDGSNTAATIYLSPMLDGKQRSNPFKLEDRKYPVDFGAPIENLYYVTIDLPEGYSMNETPAPLALALPAKGGSYKFQVTQQGNKLTVYSKLSINKVQFSSAEYVYLKEFFSQIIKKQQEQIVLKRT